MEGSRPARGRIRLKQRRTRGPPDNELDLAERGAAARRQPAVRLYHRRGQDRDRLTGGKKGRGDDNLSAAEGILKALAEQSDRAGVSGVAGLRVQRAVQLRTGGKQA